MVDVTTYATVQNSISVIFSTNIVHEWFRLTARLFPSQAASFLRCAKK